MSEKKDSITNQQIASTIQTIVLAIVAMFAQPFTLITRALLRRELGERYFTELNAGLAVVLIGVLSSVSTTTTELYFFAAWQLMFIVAAVEHFWFAVPRRYRKGVRWHSRCSGIPRADLLIPMMQWIFLGAAVLITYLVNMQALAASLLMSAAMSYVSDVIAKRQFWNRVLDAVDGQIEADELGKAVEDRLAPEQASGLNVCVPSYASAEARKKIAAALVGRAASNQVAERAGLTGERHAATEPPASAIRPNGYAALLQTVQTAEGRLGDAPACGAGQAAPPPAVPPVAVVQHTASSPSQPQAGNGTDVSGSPECTGPAAVPPEPDYGKLFPLLDRGFVTKALAARPGKPEGRLDADAAASLIRQNEWMRQSVERAKASGDVESAGLFQQAADQAESLLRYGGCAVRGHVGSTDVAGTAQASVAEPGVGPQATAAAVDPANAEGDATQATQPAVPESLTVGGQGNAGRVGEPSAVAVPPTPDYAKLFPALNPEFVTKALAERPGKPKGRLDAETAAVLAAHVDEQRRLLATLKASGDDAFTDLLQNGVDQVQALLEYGGYCAPGRVASTAPSGLTQTATAGGAYSDADRRGEWAGKRRRDMSQAKSSTSEPPSNAADTPLSARALNGIGVTPLGAAKPNLPSVEVPKQPDGTGLPQAEAGDDGPVGRAPKGVADPAGMRFPRSLRELTVAQFTEEGVPMDWVLPPHPPVQKLPGGFRLTAADVEELAVHPAAMLRVLGWIRKLHLASEAVDAAEGKLRTEAEPVDLELLGCRPFEDAIAPIREVAKGSDAYARLLAQLEAGIRQLRDRVDAMRTAHWQFVFPPLKMPEFRPEQGLEDRFPEEVAAIRKWVGEVGRLEQIVRAAWYLYHGDSANRMFNPPETFSLDGYWDSYRDEIEPVKRLACDFPSIANVLWEFQRVRGELEERVRQYKSLPPKRPW